MINIYEYVEQLSVENGETKRMNCPLCNSYKTFSVTNNMGSLLWNCYKASCNIKAGLSTTKYLSGNVMVTQACHIHLAMVVSQL